jgi:GH25 family lysozyme M1 (1,4-beta-N-acetylmuramidase)
VDYPFWLAMYTTVMDYPYKVDMWQYTSTGSVPGISGNVDLNLWFTYED